MASDPKSLRRSKNISLFRITILSLFVYAIHHPLAYILLILWLIAKGRKDLWMGLLILLIIIASNNRKYDFMSFGIVEDVRNNGYLVNKLFYKSLLSDDEQLEVGDIIKTNDSTVVVSETDLSKNILFQSENCTRISRFVLKNYFYRKLQDHPKEIQKILDHTLNNLYYQDNAGYDLGYGLIGYYFYRLLSKKKPLTCLFCLFLYNLLFVSQAKYLLIVIDIMADRYHLDRYERFTIKALLIAVINFHLFSNYAILIPLLLEAYPLIDLQISFINYLSFIESFLFCRIEIFSIFFFRYLLLYRSFLFLVSLMDLLFPVLDPVMLWIVKAYTFLNTIHLDLRGKLSLFSFLLILILWRRFQIRNRYLKLCISLLVIVSPLNDPLFHISFIDVGQGDSSLISYPVSKHCVLIDTGSEYNYQKLRKYLFSEGIYRIDHLIITHDDSDHSGNLDNLKNDFKIINIIREGESFSFRNIIYNCLPLKEYDDTNDNSLIYLLDINGLKILFTGDISSDAEKELLKTYGEIDIDILKVAHHGSRSSSSDYFISHTMPEYAMISTSGMYYHPHYQVLETLKRYGCRYFITKDQGTIKVYLTRLVDFIKTEKNEFVIIR